MRAEYGIRLATPNDLDAILAFQRAAIDQVPDRYYAASARQGWRREPVPGMPEIVAAGHYFVTACEGRLVGGAGWEPCAGMAGAALMRGVFVHPAYGGRGLGARLVRVVEQSAMAAGHPHMIAPAVLNAIGFYKRLGYSGAVVGELRFDDGVRLSYCHMCKHAA